MCWIPPLPTDGVQIPVLDAELLSLPVERLLAFAQHTGEVVRVQVLPPEVDDRHPPLPFGGVSQDVETPVVGEHRTGRFVHLDRPEPGELGGRLQPSLAHAKRLLGDPPIGDVDRHARQAVRCPRGLDGAPATGGDPPQAAIGRVDDPVHHVEGLAGPRGPLECFPDRAPVVGMDRCLEARHVERFVRRIPEERASPLRRPEDASAEVEGPESRLGGVYGQGQALLALPQDQIVAFSGERVREDLCDQLQLVDELVRPLNRCPHRVEAENTGGRRAAQREWKHQRGLDEEALGVRPVDCSLRRKLLERGEGHRDACLHLLADPGEVLRKYDCGTRRATFREVDMGEHEEFTLVGRPFPERREIHAERLADAAQRVVDRAVHVAGRQIDEPRRERCEQRVESDGTGRPRIARFEPTRFDAGGRHLNPRQIRAPNAESPKTRAYHFISRFALS